MATSKRKKASSTKKPPASWASRVRVVLVQPRNPLNIGAAARAMSNFGFKDLVVVRPHAPVWRETVSAPGAEALVQKARRAESLDEAIRDCRWVLGTTTTKHRHMDRPLVRLPDLPGELTLKGRQRVALLFGSEKTGLTNEALERCHRWVTIPTSSQCPSINLGQAVSLCCYELTRGSKGLGVKAPRLSEQRPTAASLKDLVDHALRVFDATGYLKFVPKAEREQKVRRALYRWNVAENDLAVLHGAFRYVLRRMGRLPPHKKKKKA